MKKKVRNLEKKNVRKSQSSMKVLAVCICLPANFKLLKVQIRSEGKIKKQIAALHQHHSQNRIDIASLLDEGYSEIKSLNDAVIEKMRQLDLITYCNLKSSENQDKELHESECKDVHISSDSRPVSITKACHFYCSLVFF